jgi:hypothetical protein
VLTVNIEILILRITNVAGAVTVTAVAVAVDSARDPGLRSWPQ